MNSILKNLALIVCILAAGSSFAQVAYNGSASQNGLIQVHNSVPLQDEYKIDISSLGNVDHAYLTNFFQKYIIAFGTNATFNFDVPNKVLYLAVKKQNSIHMGNITPQSLNYFLSKVYQS